MRSNDEKIIYEKKRDSEKHNSVFERTT